MRQRLLSAKGHKEGIEFGGTRPNLEEISESEFDRLWGVVSAHRAAEFDAGRMQAIPGEEVAKKSTCIAAVNYSAVGRADAFPARHSMRLY